MHAALGRHVKDIILLFASGKRLVRIVVVVAFGRRSLVDGVDQALILGLLGLEFFAQVSLLKVLDVVFSQGARRVR